MDTTSLERTCVIFGCHAPAVSPDGGQVHCRGHAPAAPPSPSPAPPPSPAPRSVVIGRDPDTQFAPATAPDMAAMEPHWDGAQWVLRPKGRDVDLDAVRALVRDLMRELGMGETGA